MDEDMEKLNIDEYLLNDRQPVKMLLIKDKEYPVYDVESLTLKDTERINKLRAIKESDITAEQLVDIILLYVPDWPKESIMNLNFSGLQKISEFLSWRKKKNADAKNDTSN